MKNNFPNSDCIVIRFRKTYALQNVRFGFFLSFLAAFRSKTCPREFLIQLLFTVFYFSLSKMQARNQLPTLLQHQTRASLAAVRQSFSQLVIPQMSLEISFVCSLS